MSVYGRFLYPHVVNLTMRVVATPELVSIIKSQAERAQGTVLEVGVGGGGTLTLYDRAKVKEIYGLDPNPGMMEQARRTAHSVDLPVKLLCAPAERIPLNANTVDTVVSTFTLCTVADVPAALENIRRVLRKPGELVFVEHGVHPDARIARLQRFEEPYISGCTRDVI